jgi:glycosyltransferase involved in cell wall biosynthesis
MAAQLNRLRKEPGIAIGVATATRGATTSKSKHDDVEYFVRGQSRLRLPLGHNKRDLRWAKDVVNSFKPDIVHVHGVERFFALLGARNMVTTPMVVSLQGFLSECVPHYFGTMTSMDVARVDTALELVTRRGLLWSYCAYQVGAKDELEILRGCNHFLGRTAWDRAIVKRHNPNARYDNVGEILRDEFHAARWKFEACRKRSVLMASIGGPLRNVETVLDSLVQLRSKGQRVELRLAGALPPNSGYGRQVRIKVAKLSLASQVTFLGYLDPGSLAQEMCQANAFVSASFVENSPNSLCEAMAIGMPCIAPRTGGIPTLIDENVSGLLFDPRDSNALAVCLSRVFGEKERAEQMASEARKQAGARHNPDRVTGELLKAYDSAAKWRTQQPRGRE